MKMLTVLAAGGDIYVFDNATSAAEVMYVTLVGANLDVETFHCSAEQWDDVAARLRALDDPPTIIDARGTPPCRHRWVAGMMYVHDEDVAAVAAIRPVVCEKCDAPYVGDPA